jgi:uncharacterized protein YjbI with pentapeptide repeats
MKTNLKKLSLKHDNIAECEFEDLNMTGSQFTNINLSRSQFHDIDFSDVVFTAAQLGGAVFKHIGPPSDEKGKHGRQRPVTFEEAELGGSTFRQVDMSNVQLVDCKIDGMTINGIALADLMAAYHKTRT